ncbi:hypothetical protein ACVWYF_003459 [Hymenobacter sp. UYAg731]
MKPNQKLIKASAAIVAGLILSLVFMLGTCSLVETVNPFDPYADTEFAKFYSPKKFKAVKAGMSKGQVKKIIGKPLYQYRDTLANHAVTMVYEYTRDGYLRKRTDKKYALVGDLAWYKSRVIFNADNVVTSLDSGWAYY